MGNPVEHLQPEVHFQIIHVIWKVSRHVQGERRDDKVMHFYFRARINDLHNFQKHLKKEVYQNYRYLMDNFDEESATKTLRIKEDDNGIDLNRQMKLPSLYKVMVEVHIGTLRLQCCCYYHFMQIACPCV